jgi:hypothetical protein
MPYAAFAVSSRILGSIMEHGIDRMTAICPLQLAVIAVDQGPLSHRMRRGWRHDRRPGAGAAAGAIGAVSMVQVVNVKPLAARKTPEYEAVIPLLRQSHFCRIRQIGVKGARRNDAADDEKCCGRRGSYPSQHRGHCFCAEVTAAGSSLRTCRCGCGVLTGLPWESTGRPRSSRSPPA